ncbi:hypothetical protein [Catellatospora vulcania]|uniref:hypothetical protein n=1 Tax=Catellatospora vulcania TaxID=1460450 RepID=UPI0012D4B70D
MVDGSVYGRASRCANCSQKVSLCGLGRSSDSPSRSNRFYDWAWATVLDEGEGCHSLFARCGSVGQLACHLCCSPAPVPLLRLVTVAGSRWSVEEAFQTAKRQVGLDQLAVPRLDRLAPVSRSWR